MAKDGKSDNRNRSRRRVGGRGGRYKSRSNYKKNNGGRNGNKANKQPKTDLPQIEDAITDEVDLSNINLTDEEKAERPLLLKTSKTRY
ncbi:MAG: hypothetical protein R2827_03850 [Bdellovibrionales bacterium]